MTIRELIEELNMMIANGEIEENARVRNAEDDDVSSVIESIRGDELVIYF